MRVRDTLYYIIIFAVAFVLCMNFVSPSEAKQHKIVLQKIHDQRSDTLAKRSNPRHIPEEEKADPTPNSKQARQTKPRDQNEWQGMPIKDIFPGCGSADHCGLARACVDNFCVPCERDGECAAGEVCILQHCLLAKQAECTGKKDCDADSLCVLSGYSFGARGNQDMKAQCISYKNTEDLSKEDQEVATSNNLNRITQEPTEQDRLITKIKEKFGHETK